MSNTLNGGKEITVTIELADGTTTTETILVRQIKVRDYDKAFKFFDDELKLNALICDKHADWIGTLAPESYELVCTTAQEVNETGFFKYAQRRSDLLMTKINNIRPELMKIAAEKISANSAPGLRPL